MFSLTDQRFTVSFQKYIIFIGGGNDKKKTDSE